MVGNWCLQYRAVLGLSALERKILHLGESAVGRGFLRLVAGQIYAFYRVQLRSVARNYQVSNMVQLRPPAVKFTVRMQVNASRCIQVGTSTRIVL